MHAAEETFKNQPWDNEEVRIRLRQHLHSPEEETVRRLLATLPKDETWSVDATKSAVDIINGLRKAHKPTLIDQMLAEYGLSSDEGVALMCLAEAYLRTPDRRTLDALIEDKVGSADWGRHKGGDNSFFVNASTWGLIFLGNFLHKSDEAHLMEALKSTMVRLGSPMIRRIMGIIMGVLGDHFVLGETIEEAVNQGRNAVKKGYRFSFDMLGEAAMCRSDAEIYLDAYRKAIAHIGTLPRSKDVHGNHGISIKLSALHPRFEELNRQEVMEQLSPVLLGLAEQAAKLNIPVNLDAEEMDRLELFMDVVEHVLASPSLSGWHGFGLVVQSYGRAAMDMLDWFGQLAARLRRKVAVRLVKGAYWDYEIKLGQILGIDQYPVFTRKCNTDLSYLACAHHLFELSEHIYPQFATHNAHTVAAILELAGPGQRFEFQRLHGMGESLHDHVIEQFGVRSRIYAPVGVHQDLLAYLVRRLLENGANSSFVNQLQDPNQPAENLARDPIATVNKLSSIAHPAIVSPADIFAPERKNSRGIHLQDRLEQERLEKAMESHFKDDFKASSMIAGYSAQGKPRTVFNPANTKDAVGTVIDASAAEATMAVDQACASFTHWNETPVNERALCLEHTADLLEKNSDRFMALLTLEAGKTRQDAVAEIREAVDFLRFYAVEGRKLFALKEGGKDQGIRQGLGPVICISPWNFPLAIFSGQIAAALVCGNSVIAKPAEQTPLVGASMISLFHESGVPENVLAFVPGDGATVGATLTADPRIAGVMFTGSTETARLIELSMAEKGNALAFLVAETGGLNTMVVDSTALPQQAVRDTIASAFQSAGQRCSALRILCVQADIAREFKELLKGAVAEQKLGDPRALSTDIGPVIDLESFNRINEHIRNFEARSRLLFGGCGNREITSGYFIPPAAIEIHALEEVKEEIFGPVLHILEYEANQLDQLIEKINQTGFGLTFGIHSRINNHVEHVCQNIKVGNAYVNRNQIGAVVGVQPFGGCGLSGTGPKAGGYLYLNRLSVTSDKPKPAPKEENLGAVLIAPQNLKGPTGERNTLSFSPRGRVLVAIDSDSTLEYWLQALVQHGCRALVSGADMDETSKECIKIFQQKYADTLEVVDKPIVNLAETENIDAALLEPGISAFSDIRKALAGRPGARIPFIRTQDDPGLLLHEKVVSEDTTASGGNASLIIAAAAS